MEQKNKTFIQREDLSKEIYDIIASLNAFQSTYPSLYDRLRGLTVNDFVGDTHEVINDLLVGYNNTGKSITKRLEAIESGSAEGFIKSNLLKGLANDYYEYDTEGLVIKHTIKDIETGDVILTSDLTYGDLSLTLEQIDQGMSPPSSVLNPEKTIRRIVTRFMLANQTEAVIEEVFGFDAQKNVTSVIRKQKHDTQKAKLDLLNNIAYLQVPKGVKITWALPSQTIPEEDLDMVGVEVFAMGYFISRKETSISSLSLTIDNLEDEELYDIVVYGLDKNKNRSDDIRFTYHSDMVNIPGKLPGQVQEEPKPATEANISLIETPQGEQHKLTATIDQTDINFEKIVVQLYEAPIQAKKTFITIVESANNVPTVLLGKLQKGLRYEAIIYTMNQAEEKTTSPLTVLFVAE